VRLQEARGFVRCPFCGISLVLELSGVRPHVLYRPRVRPVEILALLRRFCDGRGLAAPVALGAPRLTYLPFWRYRTPGRTRLVPAWPTLDPRWQAVQPPEAEQVLYDPAIAEGAEVVDGTVEEPAARTRVADDGEAAAGDLVHLPFYDLRVRSGAAQLRLALDACSARVYADDPGEAEGGRPVRPAAWLPVAALLAMLLAAAVMPVWWLAAAALAPLSVLLYLLIPAARS
jgi:hypothetical protein